MPCASSVSDNWHFAPIRREDFPLFASWLATSHVRRWWNDEPDLDAIEADYGTVVDGTEPAKVFIAHFEGRAVGLIQSFRFDAYAFYFDDVRAVYRLPANACTIDYLIGPPEALGRGLGSSMIRAFVAALWARHPDCPAVVVPVHADNGASGGALLRAGFAEVARVDLPPDNPMDSPAHRIFALSREKALPNMQTPIE